MSSAGGFKYHLLLNLLSSKPFQMALLFPSPSCFTNANFAKLSYSTHSKSTYNYCFANPIRCMGGPKMSNETVIRRSANYHPPIWDYNFVQSLRHEFVGESYTKRINHLKKSVKTMLNEAVIPLDQLELIDTLQRLGLAYHFQDEINKILNNIYIQNRFEKTWTKEDLHATALQFRLLRQHGYNISQEIFNIFLDDLGNFKACIGEDLKGLLSLYEASYLSEEGENILEVARKFATICLQKYTTLQDKDQFLSMIISHSLELPLHWRVPRLETRWFIEVYERKEGTNPLLLELSKLDFNNVQAIHQEDLKYVSWWWRNTGLGEKLGFARDRLMENFLWTVGENSEPQFGYFRRMSTKIFSLMTVMDDIYDVYGTLDELQLFTDAVERWDVNAMDQLPEYMKLCFLALHNSINEIGYDVLRKQGLYVIPYLKKAWADLCKSYLVEAKWYYSGYTPTMQEYMDNAWISISAPVILVHAYFLEGSPASNEALKSLKEYPDIIRWSSMILRFANDLGTSSDELKRGDNPKSIQCYMYETGASEAKAREHIQYLIGEAWKKINKERGLADFPFSKTFIEVAANLARMAQCVYQYGDGYGIENGETKDRVLSLLVKPIPIYLFLPFP